jgi:hypothetical protein
VARGRLLAMFAESIAMHASLPTTLTLLFALGAAGCSNKAPVRPPGVPPTPVTVTRANPGGDAADPERAALERLAAEPWGEQKDRFRTLRVALPDSPKWRRVRLWGHPTRATYRYGDHHYALATLWYVPTDGPNDPDSCLKKFLDQAKPIADTYSVQIGKPEIVRTTQLIGDEARPLVVQLLEGSVDTLIANNDYAGAIAAYQSWPGTCLVQGFAVVATKHADLAMKIRERWVAEGAPALRWEENLKDAPPPLTR